jgi:hypothetical protein
MTSPPVVYISAPEAGVVYLNIGTHSLTVKVQLKEGELRNIVSDGLKEVLRWPKPEQGAT